MVDVLKGLQPAELWKHFADLAAIPRCSKNEAAVIAHLIAMAKRQGLEYQQDAVGNLVIRKPATPGHENLPIAVLQGHVDIVCEKNEDTVHDFTRDPIRLVADGEWIKGDGTTLGADNGIGLAAAMALLESTDIPHCALECLFTVDEETGLTGAIKLDAGLLKGRLLLNLDTEEEGHIYIGCAGGLASTTTRRIARQAPPAGFSPYRLKVAGLKGGHSGMDINTGRGNAIKILARALAGLVKAMGAGVANLEGGSKHNAIPREAFAVVYLPAAEAAQAAAALATLQGQVLGELGPADPGLIISLEPTAGHPAGVFAPADRDRWLDFLLSAPHGVLAMSPDIPNLVQTSTNLAILKTDGDVVQTLMSHRSSVESSKRDVAAQVAALCRLSDFEVQQGDGYPAWQPNVKSPLLAKAKAVHQRLFGHEPKVLAVHAGLECGIIGEKFPGMDMISIGPTITGPHSPDERVHVPSVETFWRYLLALLVEP